MSSANEIIESPATATETRKLSVFEKYLTLWVFLCIVVGIILGRLFPDISSVLDKMSYAQVSIPIAICLFFMMYPIMVKIDFAEVVRAGKTPKPVLLTLFANWIIISRVCCGVSVVKIEINRVSSSGSRLFFVVVVINPVGPSISNRSAF